MRSEIEMAEALFGDGPIHGDAERAIYHSALENDLRTPDEARATADSWGQVFKDIGLNATESNNLATLRGNPTDEQKEVWRQDARTALLQDYGIEGAGQALRDAAAFLKQHSGLYAHLSKTGLGDHPMWVRTLAQKARTLKAQGRL